MLLSSSVQAFFLFQKGCKQLYARNRWVKGNVSDPQYLPIADHKLAPLTSLFSFCLQLYNQQKTYVIKDSDSMTDTILKSPVNKMCFRSLETLDGDSYFKMYLEFLLCYGILLLQSNNKHGANCCAIFSDHDNSLLSKPTSKKLFT